MVEMTFKRLSNMDVLDYAILRSVVLWNRGFCEFGEPLGALVLDITNMEYEDNNGAVLFVRDRIINHLSPFINIIDDTCESTQDGIHFFEQTKSALEAFGIDPDPEKWELKTIQEYFKKFVPIQGI